jgi:hypothetical protein
LQVLLGAVLLPLALWPFVIALSWIEAYQPELGWALVAIGLVPGTLSVIALRIDAKARTAASSAHHAA